MKVGKLAQRFFSIDADKPVSKAAELMDAKPTASLLVLSNCKPVGVITERDMLRKLVARGLCADTMIVSDLMSSPVLTVSKETELEEATKLMEEKDVRRLAVTDETGKVIGKITTKRISNKMRTILASKLVSVRNRY